MSTLDAFRQLVDADETAVTLDAEIQEHLGYVNVARANVCKAARGYLEGTVSQGEFEVLLLCEERATRMFHELLRRIVL